MSELQSQLAVETAITAEPFRALLDVAADTCLTSPDKFDAALDQVRQANPPIAPLIGRFGLWEAREAMDAVLNVRDIDPLPYKPDLEEPYLAPDKNVQDQIEAFGAALLEEAFECLGEDALAKAQSFHDTTSRKKKIEICHWLIDRIDEIKSAAPDFDDRENYHPVRLSPKVIGRFPEITGETTCLGYSILVASFFQKAATPYMHMGVASTSGDEARRAQNHMMDLISHVTSELETSIPPELLHKFVRTTVDNMQDLEGHPGFHAAVVAKIDKDLWFQFDPNYDKNAFLYPDISQKYEEAYQTLQTLKEQGVRGLEFMTVNRSGIFPHYFNVGPLHALIETCMLPGEAEQFLLELDPETALGKITTEAFTRLFEPADNREEQYPKSMIVEACRWWGIDYSQYMQDVVGEAIAEYIFPDSRNGDIRACIERCKKDREYLRRRAEDLHLAPFLALLKIQTHFGNSVIQNHFLSPHAVMETGLPEFRVGACVLSDFAAYTGDDLPPSFWMANWPSQISLAEHHDYKDSASQKTAVLKRAKVIAESNLKYWSISSIISSILEQGGVDDGHGRGSGSVEEAGA